MDSKSQPSEPALVFVATNSPVEALSGPPLPVISFRLGMQRQSDFYELRAQLGLPSEFQTIRAAQ